MTSYTKIAIRGTAITLVMHTFATVAAYLTRIVLARSLTTTEVGLFYAVFNLIIFFLFFRSLGLNEALAKYIAEFRAQEKFDEIKTALVSSLSLQLVSSIILSGTLFLLADMLAEKYFKSAEAALFLKLLLIYVILSIFFISMKGLLQGYKKMFLLSSTEFVKNVIVLVLIIIFIALGYGALSPVLAYVFVFPIIFAIYIPLSWRVFHFAQYKIVEHNKMAKKLLLFATPVFATGMGNKVIGYLDTFVLTYYRDLSEVGIYNIMLPSALIFMFFGSAVAAILFPLSSELWAKKDTKRLSEGLRLLYRYTFFFAIPFLFIIIIFSEIFVTFFFGNEYVEGAIALQILLVGVLFTVIGTINYTFLSGIGQPKAVARITLWAAILNLILNIILIPKYGMNGAAITTSASYLLALIASTIKIKDYIDVRLPIKEWAGLIVATFSFTVVAIMISKALLLNTWLEIILSFTVATIAYFIVSYMLKIIDLKELKYYIMLALKK